MFFSENTVEKEIVPRWHACIRTRPERKSNVDQSACLKPDGKAQGFPRIQMCYSQVSVFVSIISLEKDEL